MEPTKNLEPVFCRLCGREKAAHQLDACPLHDEEQGMVYSDWMKFTHPTTPIEWLETPRIDDDEDEHTLLETTPHTDPSHYIRGRKFEPWDVIEDWELDFFLGNVIKYISRAGRKAAGNTMLSDLIKARNYIDRRIKKIEDST